MSLPINFSWWLTHDKADNESTDSENEDATHFPEGECFSKLLRGHCRQFPIEKRRASNWWDASRLPSRSYNSSSTNCWRLLTPSIHPLPFSTINTFYACGPVLLVPVFLLWAQLSLEEIASFRFLYKSMIWKIIPHTSLRICIAKSECLLIKNKYHTDIVKIIFCCDLLTFPICFFQ